MFLLHVQLVDQNNAHVFPSGRTDLSINSMETSICTLRVKKNLCLYNLALIQWAMPSSGGTYCLHTFFFFLH